MSTEVDDAFPSIGVADDKARKAAEALSSTKPRFDGLNKKIDRLEANMESLFAAVDAETDSRFAVLDTNFAKLEGEIDRLFARVDGELTLLKGMLGFVPAFVVAISGKLFLH